MPSALAANVAHQATELAHHRRMPDGHGAGSRQNDRRGGVKHRVVGVVDQHLAVGRRVEPADLGE